MCCCSHIVVSTVFFSSSKTHLVSTTFKRPFAVHHLAKVVIWCSNLMIPVRLLEGLLADVCIYCLHVFTPHRHFFINFPAASQPHISMLMHHERTSLVRCSVSCRRKCVPSAQYVFACRRSTITIVRQAVHDTSGRQWKRGKALKPSGNDDWCFLSW